MQVVAINQLNFKSNDYKKENKNIERTNMSNDIKDIETFDSFESSDKKADKQPKHSVSKFFNRLIVGLAFIGGVAGTPATANAANPRTKSKPAANREYVQKGNLNYNTGKYVAYYHDEPTLDSTKVHYTFNPERNKTIIYSTLPHYDNKIFEDYKQEIKYDSHPEKNETYSLKVDDCGHIISQSMYSEFNGEQEVTPNVVFKDETPKSQRSLQYIPPKKKPSPKYGEYGSMKQGNVLIKADRESLGENGSKITYRYYSKKPILDSVLLITPEANKIIKLYREPETNKIEHLYRRDSDDGFTKNYWREFDKNGYVTKQVNDTSKCLEEQTFDTKKLSNNNENELANNN